MSASSKLLGVIREPAKLSRAWRIQRDCWSFRWNNRAVLGPGADRETGNKTVAVVSMTDFPQQNKIEGLLAKSLQRKGYSPVIVLSRACRYAPQYFRAFGFRRFAFLEDFITPELKAEARQEAGRLLGRANDLSSLMELRRGRSELGRHLLSTLTRNLLVGTVDLNDPKVTGFLREWAPKSVEAAMAAEKLFGSIRPQLALFNERGYTPYGELFDAALAAGAVPVQWVGAQTKDAFALKRYTRESTGLHPFSVSPETWEKVRGLPWPEELDRGIREELRSRYEGGTWFDRKYGAAGKQLKDPGQVRAQLRLDPAKKTAVIFSHVLWDATFFFGKGLFDSYEEWLLETIRAAAQNRNVNWVVKIHPDYVWKLKLIGGNKEARDITAIQAKFGKLPEHIRLLLPETDISTWSLFPVTDYCLTVRGTIGMEMPCFGIPVITAGTGRYSGLGFTVDSDTREIYLERVRRIEQIPRLTPEQERLARKHAFALFQLRPWRFSSFELVYGPVGQLSDPLAHDLKLNVSSPDQLSGAPDLAAFASWAADSSEPDFMAPWPAGLPAPGAAEPAEARR